MLKVIAFPSLSFFLLKWVIEHEIYAFCAEVEVTNLAQWHASDVFIIMNCMLCPPNQIHLHFTTRTFVIERFCCEGIVTK